MPDGLAISNLSSTLPATATMSHAQYEPLATGDDDKTIEQWHQRIRRNRAKNILFHLLAVLAVMFAGYQAVQAFVRSSARFLHAKPCSGGMQRNLSSLPSHYTLPSGHQIPSVALGTAAASVRRSVRSLSSLNSLLTRRLEG